jgi:hypothetical protein
MPGCWPMIWKNGAVGYLIERALDEVRSRQFTPKG